MRTKLFKIYLTILVLLGLVISSALLSQTKSEVLAAEHPWPMWRHDGQRTSQSPYVGPQTNNVSWELEGINGGEIVIGRDNIVYVGGGKGLYAINPSSKTAELIYPNSSGISRLIIGPDGTVYGLSGGNILAINPDGTLKWEYTPVAVVPDLHFVVDENGILYVINVCGLSEISGGWEYCLTAFNPAGEIFWVYDIGSDGSPSFSPSLGPDATIYFVYGQNNTLFAINPDGTEKWRKVFDNSITDFIVSPDGLIYVMVFSRIFYGHYTDIWYSKIFEINKEGKETWSSDDISDIRRFLGLSSDGILYISAMREIFAGFTHSLYAFNVNTKDWQWRGQEGNYPIDPLVIGADGIAYGIGQNWPWWGGLKLFAFDTGGFIKWEWRPTSGYLSNLAIGSDGVLYVTGTEKLYAFGPSIPEKWSFVIITDLHIGRGYSDYDGTSYEDNGGGEDYYLTERLEKVVNWINENKNKVDCDGIKCPIKFLTVLGDTTNTAEKSQFLKVKKILDKLNDPNGNGDTADGIPYVPVFGNHDVWPHTDNGNYDAGSPLGQAYFDEIFWDENTTNTKLLKTMLNFQRDEVNPNYKNFAFSYKEMNFIGLDFTSRNPWRFGPGVDPAAVLSSEDESWLESRLDEYKGESTIIFSHHPFAEQSIFGFDAAFESNEINKIKAIIENKNVLANFGGHIHGVEELLYIFYDYFMDANKEYPSVGTTPVVTTESLMVGSNEEEPKGIIRIVKVLEPTQIDYNNLETTEKEAKAEFVALNPSFSFTFTQLTELLPCVFFKAHTFTKREVSYSWAFGDGKTDVGKWDTHCYSIPGMYNATLTVTDAKTGEKEYITQKVEVKQGIIPRFLKISEEMAEKLELISTKLDEDLTKIGQVFKDNVLIKVKHSPAEPVGLITVHFEKATEDIDLTSMVADTDVEKKKSILYMPEWPEEIEESKILFIPR